MSSSFLYRPVFVLPFLALLVAAALSAPRPVGAEAASGADSAIPANPEPAVEVPTASEVEEKLPAGASLTGKELYERFLDNRDRLRTVFQRGRIASKDPGGNAQETNFWLYAKDCRDADDKPVDGVRSKAIIKVTGPYEMRHTGYLHIEREGRGDEQFLYSPNRGRTARVSLKGQSVAGTDFSFDDFLVNVDDIEDADYKRLPDETVQGIPCYVVEATMKPDASSSYSRSVAYLEKEHYVPLKARYWDDVGVEVKAMTSVHAKIREFDGAWVPTESTVTDLLEDTSSTIYVDQLEPNPELDDEEFSIARLEFRP